jgi:hypothetical protein
VLKQLLFGFIVLSMGIQMSVRAGWMAYYYIKKSEFVQYCINLDKPQLHCEGKCVLMQRLKAQETDKTPQLPVF